MLLFRAEKSIEGERTLPVLALNEVYIGELLSSRVSYLEVKFSEDPWIKTRNSGLVSYFVYFLFETAVCLQNLISRIFSLKISVYFYGYRIHLLDVQHQQTDSPMCGIHFENCQ